MSTAQMGFEASSSQNQLAFLRMAAEDDRFRAEIQTDPRGAFGRFGLDLGTAELPQAIELPSTEKLHDVLERQASFEDMMAWAGLLD